MAVCLEYQSVYYSRRDAAFLIKVQAALVCLFILCLLCRVWIRVASVDLGYQMGREKQKATVLNIERQELELQLSVLMKRDSLAGMAMSRLGLQPLNPKQARKVTY